MNQIIELTHLSTCKDGGSKSFKGSDGKNYWQCFACGKQYKENYGKLFCGDKNDKTYILARGLFVIKPSQRTTKEQIIQ